MQDNPSYSFGISMPPSKKIPRNFPINEGGIFSLTPVISAGKTYEFDRFGKDLFH